MENEKSYKEKLQEFWKYNIHPITGFGAVYDRARSIPKGRKSKDPPKE